MQLEGDLYRYILRSTLSPFAKLHIPYVTHHVVSLTKGPGATSRAQHTKLSPTLMKSRPNEILR